MLRPFCLLICTIGFGAVVSADVKPGKVRAFSVSHEVVVPGTPEQVFDLLTGDVSPWWDHTMSEKPKRLYIEPKAGGGFFEVFDDEGNCVRHAVVLYSHRGKRLVMSGPFGFSGYPLDLVATYELSVAEPGKVKVKVICRAAGYMEDGWDKAIDGVWKHFLVERFKPYAEKKMAR